MADLSAGFGTTNFNTSSPIFGAPVTAGSFSSGPGLPSGAPPTLGGSNQYMNYPSVGGSSGPISYGGGPLSFQSGAPTPSSAPAPSSGVYQPPTSVYGGGYSGQVPPGVVPPAAQPYPSPGLPYNTTLNGVAGSSGTSTTLPGNRYGVPTQDPVLTQGLDSYLSGQLGTGITPFNLQSYLPSSGTYTQAGQVAAPLNSELQQLQEFLGTGTGGSPAEQSLGQLATTGDPINQTPAWQAMVQSENQNTAEQGNALKEQFAGMGDLNSTAAGTAEGDYYSQVALGQNAQLTAASTAAQQQAVQNMSTASQDLTSLGSTLGQYTQGLDQASITALMNEYFQTTPQENPLLGLEGQIGTTYAPSYSSGGFGAGLEGSLASSLGSAVGSVYSSAADVSLGG